ncbi:hypothetical protein BDW66DRAFT_126948 [Aspergillus desertorum]
MGRGHSRPTRFGHRVCPGSLMPCAWLGACWLAFSHQRRVPDGILCNRTYLDRSKLEAVTFIRSR